MKPFMLFFCGEWWAHSTRYIEDGDLASLGCVAVAECPFVAYMRWMEKSIKAGEQ